MIIVVPKSKPGKNNVAIYMFYMPETQTTTPYEITVP